MQGSAIALFVAMLGCASPEEGGFSYRQMKPTIPAPVIDPKYQVGVGDRVSIESTFQRQPIYRRVENDGCIHLEGYSPLRVDGMTAAEIAQRIAKVRGFLHGRVHVRVIECESQFVYLSRPGGSQSPEAIVYQGEEPLTTFIERAGCKTNRTGFRVRIVRRGNSIGEAPTIIATDLDGKFQNRDRRAEKITVRANDYVYLDKDVGQLGPLTRLTERSRNWFRGSKEPKSIGKLVRAK